jgi:hypothetical protein
MRSISIEKFEKDPNGWIAEAERVAAGKELIKILRKGFDLGGLKIINRDELYDRD